MDKNEHLLKEELKHVVRDLLGSGAVDLVHLLGVRVVGVQAAELEKRNYCTVSFLKKYTHKCLTFF